jgi:division protein CdvB (Snf7/Vps24/ESCRT-III family)
MRNVYEKRRGVDLVDKFVDDWARKPKAQISGRIKDKLHPTPLKERINQTLFRLKMVQRKLEDSHLRTEHKYKRLFDKCVNAQRVKDQAASIMYANESAQLRTIGKTLVSAKLALEQVVLRLETVKDFGDVATEIMPAAETIRTVKGRLEGIIPEVSMQLGVINQSLDSLVLEAGEATGMSWSAIASGEEAEKILVEATTIAEQKIREGFPDLPTPSVERGVNPP